VSESEEVRVREATKLAVIVKPIDFFHDSA